MTPNDRIALILGRMVMRCETLETDLELAHARITELERLAEPKATSTPRKAKALTDG